MTQTKETQPKETQTSEKTVTQARRPLAELLQQDDFARRHIGPTPDEQAAMLAELGYSSLDELTVATGNVK